MVRRSRLGAWTVGSDETAGGEREQQQAQPQQQQSRARKFVLASLREGKSLVDPPAPAPLTSFFDPSVETPAELVEPEKPSSSHPAWQQQRSNGVATPVRPPQQQVPPQPHQDKLRQQQMVQQAQQRDGAVRQVTGQESQRNVIDESAKEPVSRAQQAGQATSIRENQQKQQVAERERQAKIQIQQANKPSASGWARQIPQPVGQKTQPTTYSSPTQQQPPRQRPPSPPTQQQPSRQHPPSSPTQQQPPVASTGTVPHSSSATRRNQPLVPRLPGEGRVPMRTTMIMQKNRTTTNKPCEVTAG